MKRFLVVLSFISCTNLYAQEQQQLENVRLRWQAVDYALQYEILVEQRTSENNYKTVVDEVRRNATEIECTLPVGKYRYQVIVYDLFERDSVRSDWFEFEVKPKIVQETAQEQPKGQEKKSEHAPEEALPQPREKSFWDFTAAFTYSPMITFIRIEQFKTDGYFQPLSASFRLGTIPFKTSIGNFGLEFSPAVSLLNIDVEPSIVNSVIFGFGLNALYQFSLNKTMLINVRLGGGIAVFYDFYVKTKKDDIISRLETYSALFITGALSFQYNFTKSVYLDAGADYKIMVFLNSEFHFLSPFVSIGCKF